MLKTTILNEESYRNVLRMHYESIINGRLMNISPHLLNHDELLSCITQYDINSLSINNFCTWLEIGDVCESSYNGNDFKFVKLITSDNGTISINFSQFIYGMSLYKGYNQYDSNEAYYVCTIDGMEIDPYSFFVVNKGKKLLLINFFDAVTSFDKIKRCYRFALENISDSQIKEYVYKSQEYALKQYLLYPTIGVPGTTLKTEIEGAINSRPSYTHNCITTETLEIAIGIFNDEFRIRFEDKAEELKEFIN